MRARCMMLVDLHVHTNTSSRCSSLMPDELIRRAKELGLDAVCVTEHSTGQGAQVACELARKQGFLVFRGMEVFTDLGDMLVFGWLERVRYYMLGFNELKEEVDRHHGLIIPAHPCRGAMDARHPNRTVLPAELTDSITAIETRNGAVSRRCNQMAEDLSLKYRLPATGGSDAHHVNHLGRCVTVFEDRPENEEELMEALRSGRYRPCYAEELPAGSSCCPASAEDA